MNDTLGDPPRGLAYRDVRVLVLVLVEDYKGRYVLVCAQVLILIFVDDTRGAIPTGLTGGK